MSGRSLRVSVWCFVMLATARCSCSDGDAEPQAGTAGRIAVTSEGTTAVVTVAGLARGLRAVQVDVEVSGGDASTLVPDRAWDVVEAGLADGPRSSFTVVIADTRRLPIDNGPLARLTITDGAQVVLRNAVAVDDGGVRQALSVEAAP